MDGSSTDLVPVRNRRTVGDLTTAIDLASGRRYISSVTAGAATLAGTASTTALGITLRLHGRCFYRKAASRHNLTAALARCHHAQRRATTTKHRLWKWFAVGKTITFKNANAGHSGRSDRRASATPTCSRMRPATRPPPGDGRRVLTGSIPHTYPVRSTASTIARRHAQALHGHRCRLEHHRHRQFLAALRARSHRHRHQLHATYRGGWHPARPSTSPSTGGGNATVRRGYRPVKPLDQLNAALRPTTCPRRSSGKLTISTSNDEASSTLGAITGRDRRQPGVRSRSPPRRLQLSTLRRRPVPTWSSSTTTSSPRSPPPRRMRRSTASTCSAATSSS